MTDIKPGVTRDPGHPLNKTPFTCNHDAPADVAGFQERLTSLFGTEGTTGRPWVRIVWGQDATGRDQWGWLAKTWNEYRQGGLGNWQMAYQYESHCEFEEFVNPETGITTKLERWHDVGVPRFILERFVPPEMACLAWDKPVSADAEMTLALTGEFHDAEGDRYTPYKPEHGMYLPLELTINRMVSGGVIADHDGTCCKAAKISDSICYGWYTEPGGRHLEIMEFMAAQLKRAKERRPGVLTQQEMLAAKERGRLQREAYYLGLEERMFRIALTAARTSAGGLLSPSHKAQRWGKYKFIREGAHSKSGATPDEIKNWTKGTPTNGTTSDQ